MLTTIALGIAQNALLGWLWRRAQELAAHAMWMVPVYLAMTPGMQRDVQAIFTGQGGGLSVSAIIGIIYYLYTQWQSYRATTVAQVVTSSGQKITPKPDSVAMERVETQAKAAPKRETLWDRIKPKN